ncbi:MAG: hypothetical protein R6W90_10540, partial [Ignavibacteriaceae bacterium]
MRKFNLHFIGLWLFILMPVLVAQEARENLEVPMVNPEAITLDGNMDESVWENAAKVNLVTNTGYNIWVNYYDREGLAEPEYDEYYARLLWSKDTLYAFIHIDEVVNDSAGLFWDGQWLGDQLFVSLSNRLGIDLDDDSVNYDGNVYAAPDGPYHYLILGDQVTLNGGNLTYVPVEYRSDCEADSELVFNASDWARWAVTIDEETGVWNLELAIYNPHIASQSSIAFNLGGSQGSETHDPDAGDAYMYYTWQPNISNDPFSNPTGENDPGYYNLNNSEYWAILNFVDGEENRLEMDVPMVDPEAITLDGNMDESAWENAAKVNLVTNTGYNIWVNYYDREGLAEPEYDEYYARLLWSKDTLYAFIHIDEVVNDSAGLFW